MKTNIFNLKDRFNQWQDVKRELHKIWVGNTTGPIMPMWCDSDFQAVFKNLKKQHSLKECQTALNLV
jgi:hypothetical protein